MIFAEFNSYLYLVALAWLVATSQSIVSVISLKTLQMKYHWMFRCSLVPLLLTILLVSAAAELYWIFLVQYLTILAFTIVSCWQSKRKSVDTDSTPTEVVPSRRSRFSLATLLFLTSVVASVFGLLRITPEQNWRSINSLFLIGLTAGVVGAGSCIVVDLSKQSRLRNRIAKRLAWMFVAAVLCIPLARLDWLLSFSLGISWSGWPPDPTPLLNSNYAINAFWFPIVVTHALLILVWLPLTSNFVLRTSRRYLAVLTAMVICSLPAYALVQMLKPLNTQSTVSSSNAYGDIRKLGQELEGSEFGLTYNAYGDWDLVPRPEQVSAINDAEPLLSQIKQLLNRECRVPLSYNWSDIDTDAPQEIRMLCRAIAAKSRLELDVDPNHACETLMQGLKLTTQLRRGGLFIHCLVAVASSSGLRAELVENRRYFSQAQGLASARELLALVAEIELPQETEVRERTWSRACHWTSNMGDGISTLFGVDLFETSKFCKEAMLNEIAELQIAALALAIESFHRQYSRYPTSLNELSEKLQFPLLADPYSPTQQTYVYQLTDISYTIYSLGPNRVDDGGIHDPNDLGMFRNDIPLMGVVKDSKSVPATSTGGPN